MTRLVLRFILKSKTYDQNKGTKIKEPKKEN